MPATYSDYRERRGIWGWQRCRARRSLFYARHGDDRRGYLTEKPHRYSPRSNCFWHRSTRTQVLPSDERARKCATQSSAKNSRNPYWRRNTHRSAQNLWIVNRRSGCMCQVGNSIGAAIEKRATCCGQCELAGGAVKKPIAQSGLEQAHMSAYKSLAADPSGRAAAAKLPPFTTSTKIATWLRSSIFDYFDFCTTDALIYLLLM